MPESKQRKRKRRRPTPTRASQAETFDEPSFLWRLWRKRVGWGLVAIGLIGFIGGNIGARTGLTFFPFDPHHVATQLGGGVLAILGLGLATAGEGRRR